MSRQIFGCSAFLVAAVLCGLASRSSGKHSNALWKALAAANAVFALEVLLGLRYLLHDGVNDILRALGLYASRASLQVVLLLLLVGLAMACGMAISRSRGIANRAVTVALIGAAVEAAVFLVETVSLHGVDAVMYASAGPVKVIGILWLIASSLVIFGAWLRVRR